jgi:hypothetical protein
MPYDPRYESEAKQILDFAQTVDGNLEEWYRTLPSEWKHRIISISNETLAPEDIALAEKWPGEQHVYHDVPLASIMNDYRVCRIFCCRVIMACITWLSSGGDFSGEDQAWNKSVFVIQTMVDEISACVPFHMSYELQPLAKETGQEQNGECLRDYPGWTFSILTVYSRRSFWRILVSLATIRRSKR